MDASILKNLVEETINELTESSTLRQLKKLAKEGVKLHYSSGKRDEGDLFDKETPIQKSINRNARKKALQRIRKEVKFRNDMAAVAARSKTWETRRQKYGRTGRR